MVKESKRKLAGFLAMVILAVSCMCPVGGTTMNAATKKATLETNEKYGHVYKNRRNYTYLRMNNMKKDAVYSVSVSNEKIAKFVAFTGDAFSFYLKKAGTCKVTIREKYKGKIKKVGTATIIVENGKEWNDDEEGLYLRYKEIIMEKGTKIPLETVIGEQNITKIDVENKEIVSYENKKYIKANKIGTTKWNFIYKETTFDENDNIVYIPTTKSLKFTVVEPAKGKKAESNRKLAKQINTYCKTKVTSKNADALLKKISLLNVKLSKTSGFIQFNEKNQSGRVMIPAEYRWSDLSAAKERCMVKSSVNHVALGISLEAVKVTKMTPKKVTVKLAKAINSTEVATLEGERYGIILWDKKGNSYYFDANLKAGSKTITGTVADWAKPKAGQTYYAQLTNKKNKTVKTVTIKCTKK